MQYVIASIAVLDKLSMSIQAPAGLCAELTDQADRRLVHLVNYRPDGPIRNIAVELRLPPGKHVRSITFADPLHDKDTGLDFNERSEVVTFAVPHLEVYAIAAVVWR